MDFDLLFYINALMLGVGLAMDAFSVSVADALSEPKMKSGKMLTIAGIFGIFQAFMPLAGWFCVHTIANLFAAFQKFIPWIALGLLAFIGVSMILDATDSGDDKKIEGLGLGVLLIQAIATSIDALSVGFTISKYDLTMALIEALIIGLVTFVLCMIALKLAAKLGAKFQDKAKIIGGIILIAIGFEIFLTNISFHSLGLFV